MSASMIHGDMYKVLIDVRNVPIIWANISSSVVNAGSRPATGAEGIDSNGISPSELKKKKKKS